MNVEELDSDEGMLFDYRDDVQEEISFWMKDTLWHRKVWLWLPGSRPR